MGKTKDEKSIKVGYLYKMVINLWLNSFIIYVNEQLKYKFYLLDALMYHFDDKFSNEKANDFIIQITYFHDYSYFENK